MSEHRIIKLKQEIIFIYHDILETIFSDIKVIFDFDIYIDCKIISALKKSIYIDTNITIDI